MCLSYMGVKEPLGRVVRVKGEFSDFVSFPFSDQVGSLGQLLGGQLEWVVELLD